MKKRKIRFAPDTYNGVILSDANRQITIQGIIRDESYDGCCGVFRKPFPFKEGQLISACIGRCPETSGVVKWIRDFDGVFIKAGISLLITGARSTVCTTSDIDRGKKKVKSTNPKQKAKKSKIKNPSPFKIKKK